MAEKNQEAPRQETEKPKAPDPAKREPPRRPVAEWTDKLKLRRAVVAGAAHQKGWRAETPVMEEEFRQAVEQYQRRPLGGPLKPPKEAPRSARP